MKTDQLKLGQKIFEAGEAANYFYVIKKGSVKLCLEGIPEVSVVEIGEGSYFGEYELILNEDEQIRTFSCYSNEEQTVVQKISREVFLDMFINRDRKIGEEFKNFAKRRAGTIEWNMDQVNELLKKTSDELGSNPKLNRMRRFQKMVYTK